MLQNRKVHNHERPLFGRILGLCLIVGQGWLWAQIAEPQRIVAEVVAIDQPLTLNRLGAVVPQGMIFALRGDVEPETGYALSAGNARLREGKRPRPLVLRVNQGQTLEIRFQNLVSDPRAHENQPATRSVSVHVAGMQLVNSIDDDGSNVGQNDSSLVSPGQSIVYTLYAEKEGTYLLYSTGANTGGDGDGGQLNTGLFGAVNVQPTGAQWYRSQVTRQELDWASQAKNSPAGHPGLNFEAVYPNAHPRRGKPILNMRWWNAGAQRYEIVHSDLTAIITGPGRGLFKKSDGSPWYRPNPVYPNRNRPFREFTIIYHDELGAVQAFPVFEQGAMEHTLHSVRDAFAINYGTGGIGAEILANRLGVGPMWDCVECKYEEFFLSAWTVGDPAMIVDEPANTTDNLGNLLEGPKADKALFPDDPSNVYHSYLGDHVKFRVLHGGSAEHHVHHLHAHQWLRTPDSDNSTYLDSQAFGPGGSYTMEIAYSSGNLNQTVGDSIFHCHFYPHFAQGMWAMWRVHDVFEKGTALDANGKPAKGSRALPDGEITAGTPIPGLIPVPGQPMAPMPGAKVEIVSVPGQPGGQVKVSPQTTIGGVNQAIGNPGYPFFIPGIAGHRPPHPPKDTVDDGGLPRHVVASTLDAEPGDPQNESHHVETRFDFTKDLLKIKAVELEEDGTDLEVVAMNFHAQSSHPSFTPEGASGDFITNGFAAIRGAPFADPCNQSSADIERVYKAANFQMDVVFNKAGWHFPQQRMLALWGDVNATTGGLRAPEPLFFRANSGDCIEYHHTNLVPNVYELDDFQVRTPTDILGQHIHLVKFDVTSSDGSANGFNYEDGTYSPDEVRERIHAINEAGGFFALDGTRPQLAAAAHPFFGPGEDGEFLGAQTTIQRWYADPILNNLGDDRTLRTVFTHDHYGPSTHQQVGLYAGLVVEPANTVWRDPVTGVFMGSRFDGGPTSWKADILSNNTTESYREFLLEFGDFQLGYYEGGGQWAPFPEVTGGMAFVDPKNAINPPGKQEPNPVLPYLIERPRECPDGSKPPCPEAVSADDPGTMVVNYRNEPIPLRIRNPWTNVQADGDAGDLSMVFRSDVPRADPRLDGDPFTPLLEAYENDQIQVRLLVGAHEEGHNVSIHGIKWLYEPSDANSGYRNGQMMGISEHFEFIPTPLSPVDPNQPFADYLYKMGSSVDDLWNGLWGILRTYNRDAFTNNGEAAAAWGVEKPELQVLPSNPAGRAPELGPGESFGSILSAGHLYQTIHHLRGFGRRCPSQPYLGVSRSRLTRSHGRAFRPRRRLRRPKRPDQSRCTRGTLDPARQRR